MAIYQKASTDENHKEMTRALRGIGVQHYVPGKGPLPLCDFYVDTHGFGKGYGDIDIYIRHGKYDWHRMMVEIKTDEGTLSPAEQVMSDVFRACGIDYYIAKDAQLLCAKVQAERGGKK